MSAAAKAVFEADSSKLDSALLRVQQSMLKLQKVVAMVHYGFAALKAVGNLIANEFEHVKESMTLGKELNELSARTGIAVGDLVGLRDEFKKVGKGTEDIGPAINKMQKNLAEGKAAEVIKKMGLNMEAVKRMTPLEQFNALGRAIGGLQNPMDRADAAMKIFGRTGAELLPLFAEKGFGEISKEMSNKARIFQRDAGLFADVTNSFRIVGEKTKGFWLGVADKVVPVLKPFLDKLKSLDFSKIGQQFGEAVAFLTQSIADGDIGTMLLLIIEKALAEASNYANDAFGAVAEMIGRLLGQNALDFLWMMSAIGKADFWKGLGNALLSCAQGFIAMMLDGVAKVLGAMKNIPGIGSRMGKAADAVHGQAESWRASADKSDRSADVNFNTLLDPKNRPTAKNLGSWFHGNKIDVGGIDKQLDDLMTKTMTHVAKVTDKSLADAPTNQVLGSGEIPESVLSKDKPVVSHLQRIGGGGYGGVYDSAREDRKRANSLLEKIHTGIEQVRDKLAAKPAPGLSFGYP